MSLALLFLATCFLAYSNGANDNFKGVASLFGSRVLGWYSVVDRVLGVPSVLIGNAAAQVYAARAASLAP